MRAPPSLVREHLDSAFLSRFVASIRIRDQLSTQLQEIGLSQAEAKEQATFAAQTYVAAPFIMQMRSHAGGLALARLIYRSWLN